MSEKPWKATERRVAAALGGRRVPVSGRGDGPDVRHEWLALEIKHRRRLPGWIRTALAQAKGSASPSQLPVVILHQSGERFGRAWVLLELSEWREWFGDPGPAVIGGDQDVEAR